MAKKYYHIFLSLKDLPAKYKRMEVVLKMIINVNGRHFCNLLDNGKPQSIAIAIDRFLIKPREQSLFIQCTGMAGIANG